MNFKRFLTEGKVHLTVYIGHEDEPDSEDDYTSIASAIAAARVGLNKGFDVTIRHTDDPNATPDLT